MVKSSALPKSRQELMSTLNSAHTGIVKSAECFVLKSSSEFASRSVCIFNNLNAIEINHRRWMSRNETSDSFDDHDDFKAAKEVPNVFKRPFEPRPLKAKGKAFQNDRRNRKRWIKYSLADVPLSSDATNSAVAFQFLAELRKRKEKAVETKEALEDKILFCKPKKCSKPSGQNIGSCSVSESKESVDEKSYTCFEKNNQNKEGSIPNIKLHHLEDDFNNP